MQVVLSIRKSLAYARVRRGDLRAIQIGGRGQWRVSVEALEEFIAAAYRATAEELGLQVED